VRHPESHAASRGEPESRNRCRDRSEDVAHSDSGTYYELHPFYKTGLEKRERGCQRLGRWRLRPRLGDSFAALQKGGVRGFRDREDYVRAVSEVAFQRYRETLARS
jgi:hypothetical protein